MNQEGDVEAEVEKAIRLAFRQGAQILDSHLTPFPLDEASSRVEGLRALRGHDRYSLLDTTRWVDFGVLNRISPRAAWHFAPSFMLMTLRHERAHEYVELMDLFRFTDDLRSQMEERPSSPAHLREMLMTHLRRMPLEEATSLQPGGPLKLDWYCRVLSFYSPQECKAVAAFLRWLCRRWPDDEGLGLMLEAYWSQWTEPDSA